MAMATARVRPKEGPARIVEMTRHIRMPSRHYYDAHKERGRSNDARACRPKAQLGSYHAPTLALASARTEQARLSLAARFFFFLRLCFVFVSSFFVVLHVPGQ